MDVSSIIIGAIVVALCIVPFIVMSQNRKKRERKTIESLNSIAQRQNCSISKHEICGDFIIGIDEVNKYVFFLKKLNDKVVEQCVNLSEIRNCKLNNTARTVANQSVIDKLELSFIPIDKNKKEIALEFFNTDINMQLGQELRSIEQWSNFINDYLKIK